MRLVNKKLSLYTIKNCHFEVASFKIHIVYIKFMYETFKIFQSKIFDMLFIEWQFLIPEKKKQNSYFLS